MGVEQFAKDYYEKDHQWEQMIRNDISLGAQSGVRGTPTFFINGHNTCARNFTSFKREIDGILKQ